MLPRAGRAGSRPRTPLGSGRRDCRQVTITQHAATPPSQGSETRTTEPTGARCSEGSSSDGIGDVRRRAIARWAPDPRGSGPLPCTVRSAGMFLQKLELQGFKSFVDRTSVEFGGGITGVV